MDELLSDFLSETAEHIEGVESYLILFEQKPSDPDALTHIFRLLHTIKGTSGFFGLERLRSIAHAAETLIVTLRNGAPAMPLAVSLLLQAMDRIKQLLARIAEDGREPAEEDHGITGKIDGYLRGELASPDPLPPSSEPTRPSKRRARPRKGETERSSPMPEAAAEGSNAAVNGEARSRGTPAPEEAASLITEADQTPAKEKAPDTIRISLAAIQRIMDLVSELVLTRNQIVELSRQQVVPHVKAPLERLSTVTSDLQDAVMHARMQPMSRLFASIPRLVRELSIELQKKYNLVIEGADTELDRQLIEAIRDPILHLIRNCADHGIESPEDRIAAGKPEAGKISIAAFYESGQVHIEIADDGRGLDADSIRRKAIERGLGSAETIANMSDGEVYRFILLPGFSTARAVTKISGRGVGMDVVVSRVEAIGGTVTMQASKGRGSEFGLQIPLTLAIAPALIVKAGSQEFAIPQQCVIEAVSVEESSGLHKVQEALVLKLRDEVIPVAELETVLQLQPSSTCADKLVIILSVRGNKFGVLVDDVARIQEIVVQPLGRLFSSLKLFSGNTVLGDGSIVLILDPAGLAGAMSLELSSRAVQAQNAGQCKIAQASNLILFKAGSGAPKVVPQSSVLKIVRPRANALYRADGLTLHRYQERLIPVLPIEAWEGKMDKGLIIIIAGHDRIFGLWAEEVMDIVETAVEIQLASNSTSIIGTMDLQGHAVEFIDTEYYYDLAYPAAPGVGRELSELPDRPDNLSKSQPIAAKLNGTLQEMSANFS
jgi:two-component system, chemotaxis family, sensor kinase CheA